jgi:hypothetical protein
MHFYMHSYLLKNFILVKKWVLQSTSTPPPHVGRRRHQVKTPRSNLYKNGPGHRPPHCQEGPRAEEDSRTDLITVEASN